MFVKSIISYCSREIRSLNFSTEYIFKIIPTLLLQFCFLNWNFKRNKICSTKHCFSGNYWPIVLSHETYKNRTSFNQSLLGQISKTGNIKVSCHKMEVCMQSLCCTLRDLYLALIKRRGQILKLGLRPFLTTKSQQIVEKRWRGGALVVSSCLIDDTSHTREVVVGEEFSNSF